MARRNTQAEKAQRRQKRQQQKAAVQDGNVRIDLLKTVQLLHQYLTQSLCQEVFQMTRTNQRQRQWSLQALVEFWVAVILRAPQALRQALEEAREGKSAQWPQVETSPEAFFQRCQHLSWTFFAKVFERFVLAILPETTPCFAAEVSGLRERFPQVWIWDGSRLDAIAHRLKLLWDVRSPVLPGCLLAVYDLFRGIPRLLRFDANAAKSEMERMRELLAQIPVGTLLLGDRLSASVQLFWELGKRGIYGLFRRNGRLSWHKLRRLSRQRVDGGVLEDWLVEVGSGATAPQQRVRLIRFRRAKVLYELFTDVLDPQQLRPEEAINLYPQRWSVERLFFDLKEVLNLHRFYAANPNAVGMQVYAAALVYTAMRIAQAHAAQQARVKPEEISPQKFFVRVAVASSTWATIQLATDLIRQANPGMPIREPNWKRHQFASTTLKEVRVQKRKGKRRKRRFCASRRRWKSFAHIPGGRRLIQGRN